MLRKSTCAQEVVWTVCGDFNCVINWLDNWQTLLTGIGAIVAATVSIYYLRKQISDAATQETARRLRRFTAARARMPLLLSETVQYANDSMDLLKSHLDAADGSGAARGEQPSLLRPELPQTAIVAFENIIENTDDAGLATNIADMISQMQVLNSRLGGLPNEWRGLGIHNIQAYLMNAAKIYGYAASMLKYARRETDTVPDRLEWQAAISGLRLRGMYEDHYPDLHAFMVRAQNRESDKLA